MNWHYCTIKGAGAVVLGDIVVLGALRFCTLIRASLDLENCTFAAALTSLTLHSVRTKERGTSSDYLQRLGNHKVWLGRKSVSGV